MGKDLQIKGIKTLMKIANYPDGEHNPDGSWRCYANEIWDNMIYEESGFCLDQIIHYTNDFFEKETKK